MFGRRAETWCRAEVCIRITLSERSPVPVPVYLDFVYRMDFPERTALIADLLRMLFIPHEPAPYLNANVLIREGLQGTQLGNCGDHAMVLDADTKSPLQYERDNIMPICIIRR
jgi:hypothetical protein